MWSNPGLRAPEQTGDQPGSDVAALRPAMARHRHRERAAMRQTLVAAAIAAGLVALWAALLSIAA